MVSADIASWFAVNQEALWVMTLMLDLTGTIVLYRLFGKVGLQVAIATAIILANLQGPKLTIIFGLETSLGVIFYSSIFFATDVLSENYGRREAARAVWMGFTVSIIVLVMMTLALLFQPSTNPATAAFSSDVHQSFETILGFSWRFVLGSLFAYLVSQRFDVWAFHKIRSVTGERWLWMRNNGSTIASQAVDTTLYSLVVWWGTVDLRTALALGAAKMVFKVAIAIIDTAFIYWARRMFLRQQAMAGGRGC